MKKEKNIEKASGFLGMVERVGNALPHPVIIFIILSFVVVLASAWAQNAGLSVTYFDAITKKEVTKSAVSLLNPEGLRWMLNSATKNFTGFAPLGTVLVAMLGAGIAESTGLIGASLKKVITSVPKPLLTAVVIFAGIMSNMASDAGYVIVIPLGAIMFASAGRHPLAGLAAAFAGVSAGFSANLLIGTTDTLLMGITNEALSSMGYAGTVNATSNLYFMQVSTILLTVVGTIVTESIIEKRLGKYTGNYVQHAEELTPIEEKGLKMAGISIIAFVILLSYMMFDLPLPGSGVLREANKAGEITLEAFMRGGLIPVMAIAFGLPGVVYGFVTGKLKNSSDIVAGMADAMKSMGGYLVLAFFCSQFIAYFNKTNLGTIIAFNGAKFLESIKLVGLPLAISFVLISAFLNLFMGSASAKWAIMAPIFIPMMLKVGMAPEFTQLAYRIGDSSTNIITPLMSYFAMIIIFMKKYDEDSGLGTLISMMLPYSMAFLISWIVLMIIWYLVGIPIGPGAKTTVDIASNIIKIFI